jgi:hypothetical protein
MSWLPVKFGGDRDASKAVVFDEDSGLLSSAVFEKGSKPGVDVARNVNGCCNNEVIPANVSVLAS